MKNIKTIQTKKQGYILVFTLVILSIMMVMVYYSSSVLFAETAIARNQKAATVALNLAEAGIQDAKWQIQNDPSARTTFLNSENGHTSIPTKTLLSGGTYTVDIQNDAKASATITSTGFYNFGSRTAQRKITLKVIQNGSTEPYSYDAALFSGAGGIDLNNVTINGGGPDPWSIYSGGIIDFGNSSVITVPKDILANGSISPGNSTINYDGAETANYPTEFVMPGNGLASYATQSLVPPNHNYTPAQFATATAVGQPPLSGIVYVNGNVEIKNRSVTINGLLVVSGSISVNHANLTINHVSGEPSGLIAGNSFDATNATINITGLVYASYISSASVNTSITITGAILAYSFDAVNITLTLNLDKTLVNDVLIGGGNTGSPIIEFNHWEEEY